MTKISSNHDFVVIPEAIAELLDRNSTSTMMDFGFSAASEADEVLPTQDELRQISYTELSGDALTKARRDGRLNHTVYPAVRYFPQVVTIGSEAFEPAAAKAIKRPVASALKNAPASMSWKVKVTDASAGTPIPNVDVFAFVQPGRKSPVVGVTDARGEATLQVPLGPIDELILVPPRGHWSRVVPGVVAGPGIFPVSLSTLQLTGKSAAYMSQGPAIAAGDGSGVKVGVIDTGVGPHADLTVSGGTPPASDRGGSPEDCSFHGTHVAGIIAGNGGVRGFAPGCEIFSYRVLKAGQKGALNGDIVAAIIQSIRDGCHIINLSLGAERADPLVKKALEVAMDNGVLVIAASGNGNGKRVDFPARLNGVVSVSAVGCETTYPANSTHALFETTPRGKVASQYVAKFANVGRILCCTAPGVAVISTVPGGYSAMDGTSMAAPAVTGIAACLLSANPAILAQKPDSSRTTAMRSMLYAACNSLGFDPRFEGSQGLPS